MNDSNVIIAALGGGRTTVTASRFMEDYGQVLKITGVELPDVYQVDFSNNLMRGTSMTVLGNADGVAIPDEYISTGRDVYAFLYLTGDMWGRTIATIRIPNKTRPKRTDAIPTPTQQGIIDQAITALNSAVDTTTQKAQEASASADRAEQAAEGVEGYAERAESAQQAAESARDRATQAETSARTSAATASEKASEAISSATTASQSAMTAENASESAQEYATASAESASQASQSADTASGKASDAQGYASSADTSAQTASQKASEAAQSASTAVQAKTDAESAKTASQTAQGLAESARDNAITAKNDAESARDEAQEIVDGITGKVEQIDSNTGRIESLEDDRYKPYPTDSVSGSIASFPDGADGIPLKSCIVQVEPVQDLHGYDSPWPAGGGVNLLDFGKITVSGTHYGMTFSKGQNEGTVTVTGTLTVSGGAVAPIVYADNSLSGKGYVFLTEHISGNSVVDLSRTYGFRTENERAIAVYLNGTAGQSYTETIRISVYAPPAPTSWTPYSNICPITGWTGAKVTRCGKNLANIKSDNAVDSKYITVSGDEGYLTFTSTDAYGRIGYAVTGLKIGQRYTFSAKMTKTETSGTNSTVYLNNEVDWKAAYSRIGIGTQVKAEELYSRTFVATTDVLFIGFYVSAGVGYPDTITVKEAQLELGSTATPYEPYSGQTYDITFPSEAGTIYGGTLDVTKGELVVDRATVDMGSMVWNYNTTYAFFTSNSISTRRKIGVLNVWSDLFKTMAGSWSGTPVQNALWGNGSNATLYVQTPPLDNVNDFMALVDGHQLMYELATPITYTLTASQITTLLGQNNVWADCGDTSVTYRADTTLYISRLTEPDADMVADSNIVSGQYFMVGNTLYKATANIASGATISPNVNCTRKSLSEALNELNA